MPRQEGTRLLKRRADLAKGILKIHVGKLFGAPQRDSGALAAFLGYFSDAGFGLFQNVLERAGQPSSVPALCAQHCFGENGERTRDSGMVRGELAPAS